MKQKISNTPFFHLTVWPIYFPLARGTGGGGIFQVKEIHSTRSLPLSH